jgi:hypothetical protein
MGTYPDIVDHTNKHNAHILLYFRFMHFVSVTHRLPFSQIHYYTLYNQELDPNWKPEHMRRDIMPD